MYDGVYYPQVVRLDATWRCNLNCKHCQTGMFRSPDHPEDMTDSDWQRLFRELAFMGTSQINFLGGEPLLRQNLPEHVANLRRLGITSDITTNGILINEDIAKAFMEQQAVVTVSLDGASAATHNFIRGRNTFERTIRAVHTIVEQQRHSLGGHTAISAVLNRNNVHEATELIELALELGVNSLILASVHHVGNAKDHWDDLALNPETLYEAGVAVARRMSQGTEALNVRVNFFTAAFRNHLLKNKILAIPQEPQFDRASLFECYMQCDGRVYPSQKFSEMNPDILERAKTQGLRFERNDFRQSSFLEIWEGAEFEAYRAFTTSLQFLSSYEVCQHCQFAKTYCIPNAGSAIAGENTPQVICDHLQTLEENYALI
jgi:MoaA/NifB/PqqE/SkfB family radical SAM enzyme